MRGRSWRPRISFSGSSWRYVQSAGLKPDMLIIRSGSPSSCSHNSSDWRAVLHDRATGHADPVAAQRIPPFSGGGSQGTWPTIGPGKSPAIQTLLWLAPMRPGAKSGLRRDCFLKLGIRVSPRTVTALHVPEKGDPRDRRAITNSGAPSCAIPRLPCSHHVFVPSRHHGELSHAVCIRPPGGRHTPDCALGH